MTIIPLWQAAAACTKHGYRPSFRSLLRRLSRPDCPIQLRTVLSPCGREYPAVARKDLGKLWALLGPQPTQLPLPLKRARRRISHVPG